ncbi:LysR family transcriptional regulator [Pectobacterium sp. B1J-3]|uniref:LysR family transcriptional regulator n=1 Tax=Pectobacterium sp. B1J-3 TaxID=3385371 RepID=UPI0039059381
MEIADFRTLIALVEHGGITAAAKILNRVPSAVTTRLQQLEHSLGVSLFVREKKRFILTPEGQTLYEHALQIIALVTTAESQVKGAEPGGKFRLGAMDSMAATRLPKPLAALYRRYSDLELELSTGISRFLYESLINNHLDAAFIADAPQDDRLERVAVFSEELVIVASAGHKAIREPNDIGKSSLLVFRDGCSYRDRFTHWFHMYDREPARIAEMTSYHAILGGISAGMGVGIVPRHILTLFPDLSLISVHPFNEPSGNVITELLWRKGRMSANIQALRNEISSIDQENTA